jgi:nucleoside-diphosphate-sugar epimerase
MRVLVIGGAGYIGSRLVAHLLINNFHVTVFDRLAYGGEALLPFIGHEQFRFVAGDIRDADAVAPELRGTDAVVHLAAIVGEPACARNESDTVAINRDAAITTLRRAEAEGVDRFVFLSTCSNYGVSDADALADEDSRLRPLSLYARTKVEVEEACLAHSGRLTVTVLRLGTVCGLSARMRFDLLISELARAAVRGEPIDIYKPAAWRPFLHIADAARAVAHVLGEDRRRVNGRVFNVVGGNFQKQGLVDIVKKHFPKTVVKITDANPDNRDYRVSGARVERDLGFYTQHTIEDAFVETADAVRAGIFHDPLWRGHSAIPLPEREHLLSSVGN